MSKFKVFPDKLKNEVNDFEEYEKTLFRIQQEINSIKNNLGFKISSSNYIGGRLRSIVDDVFKESVSMNVLAGSLSEICSNYSDTEKRICGENGVWSQIWSEDGASLKKGEYNERFTAYGTTATVDAMGNFIYAKGELSGKAECDWKEGNVEAVGEAKLEGAVVRGQCKVGIKNKYGFESETSAEGALLEGEVKGSVGASLLKKGEFNPVLKAEALARAAVASGKVEQRFGSEQNNVYGGAEGEVLGAEAKAEALFSAEGIKAEVAAEAYLTKGSVKSGFTILGIKFEGELEGKAGGVGLEAGAGVKRNEVNVSLGAGLGLGVGIKLRIDCSDFKIPFFGR